MKKFVYYLFTISLLACNSQKDIKTDYEIKANETFEIELKSNPTTGYSWKWVKNDSPSILDSVSATYLQDKAEAGMTGVGGKEIWKFKGVKSGIDSLKFEYSRPWEKDAAAEKKKVIVKIK